MMVDKQIIGIDFGNSSIKVARWNGTAKQAEIVRNELGEETTPSWIFADGDDSLFGTPALDKLDSLNPGDLECSRLMHGFKAELKENLPKGLPDGTMTSPRELLNSFLRHLKKSCHLSEPSTLSLSCSATFTDAERTAIRKAAADAGFSEIVLIEEPLAAVLGCAATWPIRDQTILVVDVGGKAANLAIVKRRKDGSVFMTKQPVVCKGGGDDFDRLLYDNVERKIGTKPEMFDLELLNKCRIAREKLSAAKTATIATADSEGKAVKITVSRDELEMLLKDRIDGILETIRNQLEKMEDEGCSVDTILLVGGCAKMPVLKQGVENLGAKAAVCPTTIDQECALGAVAATVFPALCGKEKEQAGDVVEVVKDIMLTIESDPIGAEITLDGNKLGKSPVTVPIKAGEHLCLATMFGYHAKKVQFKSAEWKAPILPPIILRPFVGLYIESQPDGASVWVNKEKVEGKTTPCRVELEPGQYFIEVEINKTGYPKTGQLINYAGTKMGVLHLDLKYDKEFHRLQELAQKKIEHEAKLKQELERQEIIKAQQKELERSRIEEARKKEEERSERKQSLWCRAEEARKVDDWRKAIECYELLKDEFEDARAIHRLGECIWNGRGADADKDVAKKYFHEAAQKGLTQSTTVLGCIEFIDKKYENAVNYFKQAETNDPKARMILNTCYKYGWGVTTKIPNQGEVRTDVEAIINSRKELEPWTVCFGPYGLLFLGARALFGAYKVKPENMIKLLKKDLESPASLDSE